MSTEVAHIAGGIKKQWNFVNSLTAFRAFAVLPAVLFQYFGMSIVLFVVLLLAVMSDAEGYIARWTKTTTSLGKVFDPLADKLFTNTMILMYLFGHEGSVSVLLLLICNIGYDIDNSTRRIQDIVNGCLGNRIYVSTPVTFLSKCKTAFLFGIIIYMFLPVEFEIDLIYLIDILSLVAVLLVVASWWHNRKETIFVWLN